MSEERDTETTPQADDLPIRNARRLINLEREGYGLDPLALLKARLDMITNALVDLGVIDMDQLDATWEQYIEAMLDQAEADIARSKLVLPDSQNTIVDL